MDIREKIRGAGLKATPQRRLVYQTMQELCHTSIDEIIARVAAQSPEVTVSTIYRIMESFCAAGLLSRINHPEGRSYYDINPTEHHHIFMADSRIVDFEDSQLTALIAERIESQIGPVAQVKRVSIQVVVE